MIKINLDDRIFDNIDVNEKKLFKDKIIKIVNLAVKEENLDNKNIYVTIEAVDNKEIKRINKEYRNIDKETDVLSFPIFEKYELDEIRNNINNINNINEIEIGDIFLCMDVIKKQAIEYETGLKRELLYMITHGIFHLLGYDHIDEDDKKIMRAKEEKVLKSEDI